MMNWEDVKEHPRFEWVADAIVREHNARLALALDCAEDEPSRAFVVTTSGFTVAVVVFDGDWYVFDSHESKTWATGLYRFPSKDFAMDCLLRRYDKNRLAYVLEVR